MFRRRLAIAEQSSHRIVAVEPSSPGGIAWFGILALVLLLKLAFPPHQRGESSAIAIFSSLYMILAIFFAIESTFTFENGRLMIDRRLFSSHWRREYSIREISKVYAREWGRGQLFLRLNSGRKARMTVHSYYHREQVAQLNRWLRSLR